jgi:hypothetical protein
MKRHVVCPHCGAEMRRLQTTPAEQSATQPYFSLRLFECEACGPQMSGERWLGSFGKRNIRPHWYPDRPEDKPTVDVRVRFA